MHGIVFGMSNEAQFVDTLELYFYGTIDIHRQDFVLILKHFL